MPTFTLTVDQLESILQKAKADDNQEDILTFAVNNGRLQVKQSNWGHTESQTLLDKPC